MFSRLRSIVAWLGLIECLIATPVANMLPARPPRSTLLQATATGTMPPCPWSRAATPPTSVLHQQPLHIQLIHSHFFLSLVTLHLTLLTLQLLLLNRLFNPAMRKL
jgi:hypothetical protein